MAEAVVHNPPQCSVRLRASCIARYGPPMVSTLSIPESVPEVEVGLSRAAILLGCRYYHLRTPTVRPSHAESRPSVSYVYLP